MPAFLVTACQFARFTVEAETPTKARSAAFDMLSDSSWEARDFQADLGKSGSAWEINEVIQAENKP